MQRNKHYAIIIVCLLGILISAPRLSIAQENQIVTALPAGNKIYVNANIGKNNNDGTQSSPLQTLSEAAKE